MHVYCDICCKNTKPSLNGQTDNTILNPVTSPKLKVARFYCIFVGYNTHIHRYMHHTYIHIYVCVCMHLFLLCCPLGFHFLWHVFITQIIIPNVTIWMLFNERYRGMDDHHVLVQWLWTVLENFTNDERIQFLRFISGRTRLPSNPSDITQRFQIMKSDRVMSHFLGSILGSENYLMLQILRLNMFS